MRKSVTKPIINIFSDKTITDGTIENMLIGNFLIFSFKRNNDKIKNRIDRIAGNNTE